MTVYEQNPLAVAQCAAIISVPDFCGGHDDRLEFFCTPSEMNEYIEHLRDFHYCEWSGTLSELLLNACDLVMTAHKEPLHEEPIDYVWSVAEEIARIKRLSNGTYIL